MFEPRTRHLTAKRRISRGAVQSVMRGRMTGPQLDILYKDAPPFTKTSAVQGFIYDSKPVKKARFVWQDCRTAATALAGRKGVEMFSFFTLKINAFHTVFDVTESLSVGVTHIQSVWFSTSRAHAKLQEQQKSCPQIRSQGASSVDVGYSRGFWNCKREHASGLLTSWWVLGTGTGRRACIGLKKS